MQKTFILTVVYSEFTTINSRRLESAFFNLSFELYLRTGSAKLKLNLLCGTITLKHLTSFQYCYRLINTHLSRL